MIDKLTELEQLYGGRLTPNGMIDHDYKNDKVRFLRFAGAHCPICGKNHWCQINVTGTKVVCQNIATTSNDNEIIHGFRYLYTIEKINGKLFELVDSNRSIKYVPSIYKTVPTFKLASPKALDIMNRLVLTAYSLNSTHKRNLLDRSLTKDQIILHGSRGFGSFYIKNDKDQDYFKQVKSVKDNNGDLHILSRWTHALKKLKLPINLWCGVPGFYNFVLKKDNKIFEKVPLFSTSTGSNHPSEGMIVPYWDIYNRVQTFQIRVDNPHKYATNIKVNERLLSGELKIWLNSDDRYRAVVYYKKYGQKTRLIAKAIYQKQHWDDSQIIEAAKIIYPYIGYKTNVNTVNNRVDIPLFVSEQKQQQLGLNGKSDQTYCIPIYFRMEQKEYYKRFLILSDSKKLYRHHYTDVYHNKKSSFARYSYLSKEYLLGFATIIRNFFEQCKKIQLFFQILKFMISLKDLLVVDIRLIIIFTNIRLPTRISSKNGVKNHM